MLSVFIAAKVGELWAMSNHTAGINAKYGVQMKQGSGCWFLPESFATKAQRQKGAQWRGQFLLSTHLPATPMALKRRYR